MNRQTTHEQYLSLLTKQFPTSNAVSTEIINLKAILQLPKGTEHFMSDLHGEYEAFHHILNNCSGVIREKIDLLFGDRLDSKERGALATLIYYPEQKLALHKTAHLGDLSGWYYDTIQYLVEVCRVVSAKYTRSKVRKAMPADFAYIIDELIHADYGECKKQSYYQSIIASVIEMGRADLFISAISRVIKRLSVDHLHILGDIYDRGGGAEEIIDALITHHAVDIQWGNHDVLWMGAAAGSYGCIATVLNTSLQYGNVDTLENGYGISLRALASFADKTYRDGSAFTPKVMDKWDITLSNQELVAKIRKAIAVIQLKSEGRIIRRHPEYEMNQRLMLNFVDFQAGTVTLEGKTYPLKDTDFPTIDPNDPYKLTDEEELLMIRLAESFKRSPKLKKHMNFLFEKGSFYLIYNDNLLFHGCMPLESDGSFSTFHFEGKALWGKTLFDYCDEQVRKAYFLPDSHPQKQSCMDFVWYLWCGKNSPLLGKTRMTTFERMLVADKSSWEEPRNHYYHHMEDQEMVKRVLTVFGITAPHSHIINGHMPVKLKDGESPVKAEGRLLVIDGGFCKAYQPTTGIAGYTLIYNSRGMRMIAHEPFDSIATAVRENLDIHSTSNMLETAAQVMRVADTDIGTQLRNQIKVLEGLLEYYNEKEQH